MGMNSMFSRSVSTNSFSNLSVASNQNIRLSENTNNDNGYDEKSESIQEQPTKRRSSRIKRKRDLGFKTYYTPKQWEPLTHYGIASQPPLKKRKTMKPSPNKVRKSSRSNNKPKQTYIETISDSDDELYIPTKYRSIKKTKS